MKKLIAVVLVLAMSLGFGTLAFAEDDGCVLPDEVVAQVIEIKGAFLADMVEQELMTQEEADEYYDILFTRSGNDVLKTLGFGAWLQSSEYVDIIFDILPHKSRADGAERAQGGRGQYQSADGTGRFYDAERHAEMLERGLDFHAERHEAMMNQANDGSGFGGHGRGRGK